MPVRAGAIEDAKAGLASANRGDYETAIQLYTKAIEAGTLPPDLLSAIFDNRGMAYHHNGRDDLAIADYDQAIHLVPNDAHALDNRGNAYYAKGEFARAIDDYDQAIRLMPSNFRAYDNRGNAWYSEAQIERALQDYDKALALNPNSANSHEDRSNAYFLSGRFAAAEGDLRAAIKLDATHIYAGLRLYSVMVQQGEDARDGLAQLASAFDLTAWPGPIVRFYLGQISAGDVFASAGAATDDQIRRGRFCEADFYLGEEAIRSHDIVKARELLGMAQTTCPQDFVEFKNASAELQRLSGR